MPMPLPAIFQEHMEARVDKMSETVKAEKEE